MKNRFENLMKDTVTLYHLSGTDAQGRETYTRYVLSGVQFERRESVLPVESGSRPYNSFKLNVKTSVLRNGLIYADKSAFAALTPAAQSRCWTVGEGDFLTVGETSFDIPNDTVDDVKNAGEVFTVNTLNPYRIAGCGMLEISGRGRIIY